MSEKYTTQELVNQLAKTRGITKKMAEEWVRILPGIIDDGLMKDGFVKVRGLGTFKLKWVDKRIARNMKTGEEVEVPAHSRVIFQAEKKIKEMINEEYKKLSYSVIDEGKTVASAELKQPEKTGKVEDKVPSKLDKVETPPPKKEETAPPPAPPNEKKPEKRKTSRYYWIIPLTFVVIIILAIIFYLRNCTHNVKFEKKQPSEQVIGPSSEPESAEQGTTESQPAKDTVVTPETKPEKPAPELEEKSPPAAQPAYKTPEKTVVTEGEWLFQLAREHYGNPFLWVLIYKANTDKLLNPENVPTGLKLVIPGLEGTPGKLSHNDSLNVSEGYKLVYEYYLGKNDEKAKEYRQGMIHFQPGD